MASQQQTDRQEAELKEFAARNGLNFNEKTDMYIDIISGFKDGEARPQYSILKNKVEAGLYQQILFSEFSRLDRKPSNLLKSIEYYQSKNVWLWFVDNDDHLFTYDRETHNITEKITSLVQKTYTFEEFNSIAALAELKNVKPSEAESSTAVHLLVRKLKDYSD